MAKLTINKLIIISDEAKKANVFEFGSGKNLITSNQNTVGKTTLVKMILSAFGCKPAFNSEWKNIRAKSVLEFNIDETKYTLQRNGNQMALRKGKGKKNVYSKISGDYSQQLADILCFKPIFKLSNSENHQVSYPDGYFMAYYLDQENWKEAWKSLEGLAAFDSYKKNLVKAHAGLLTSEYFDWYNNELLAQDKKKEEEKRLNIFENSVITVQNECNIKADVNSFDSDEFKRKSEELRTKLSDLQVKQSELWSSLSVQYNRKNHLESQVKLLSVNINELDQDYQYSKKQDHILHCPVCNSIVQNDVLNKASLQVEKQSCENVLESFITEIQEIEGKLLNLKPKYNSIIAKIEDIQKSFIGKDQSGNGYTTEDYLKAIAEKAILEKLNASTAKQALIVKQADDEIKGYRKEKNRIAKNVNKEAINSFFCSTLKACMSILGLDFETIQDKVKSPTDYINVLQGGAADKTRSVLSYYSALYLLIKNQNIEVLGPLFIDTPMQQEQSDDNKKNIMRLINEKFVNNNHNQIFLCAKDDKILNEYKDDATIFSFNKKKGLLFKDKYDECCALYDSL